MSIKLSVQEIEELRKLQRNVSRRADYVRVTCILMLAMGCSPDFVAQSLGIDVATVYRYKKLYDQDGIDGLLEDRYRGYSGRLYSEQISLLCKEFKRHIYTDAKRVTLWVKNTFEIGLYTGRDGTSVESHRLLLQEDNRGSL